MFRHHRGIPTSGLASWELGLLSATATWSRIAVRDSLSSASRRARLENARAVAELRGIDKVYSTLEEMLDDPAVDIMDIAVPPDDQPALILRILGHPPPPCARNPGTEAACDVLCGVAGRSSMAVRKCRRAASGQSEHARMITRCAPSRRFWTRSRLGEPVLATIEMRAIPHWMPWAEGRRSLSTFIMSIHHLDTFRYWLGDPSPRAGQYASRSRAPDLRAYGRRSTSTSWSTRMVLGRRGGTMSGPGPRVRARIEHTVRWRFEGTEGLAHGRNRLARLAGQACPARSIIPSIGDNGAWHRPRWTEAWFPDAFSGHHGRIASRPRNRHATGHLRPR